MPNVREKLTELRDKALQEEMHSREREFIKEATDVCIEILVNSLELQERMTKALEKIAASK